MINVNDMVIGTIGFIIEWGWVWGYYDGSNYLPSLILPMTSDKKKVQMMKNTWSLKMIKGAFRYRCGGWLNREGLCQIC